MNYILSKHNQAHALGLSIFFFILLNSTFSKSFISLAACLSGCLLRMRLQSQSSKHIRRMWECQKYKFIVFIWQIVLLASEFRLSAAAAAVGDKNERSSKSVIPILTDKTVNTQFALLLRLLRNPENMICRSISSKRIQQANKRKRALFREMKRVTMSYCRAISSYVYMYKHDPRLNLAISQAILFF